LLIFNNFQTQVLFQQYFNLKLYIVYVSKLRCGNILFRIFIKYALNTSKEGKMKLKSLFNFFVNTFLFSIVLLCLIGISASNVKAQTGNLKIVKITCASEANITDQNTCNERLRDQQGKVFSFTVTAAAGSPPPPTSQIDVTIGQSGNGSEGDTTTPGFAAGTFTVCENFTLGFKAIPRPESGNGGSTGGGQTVPPGMPNCIQVTTSGSGNAVLKFFNVPLAPTAATALVSGRIRDVNGKSVSRVTITLTNLSNGEAFTTRTNLFGRYTFEDMPTGQNYLISASSKRHVFSLNEVVINLLEDLTDANFTAIPNGLMVSTKP
jgi:hypothetical protein